MPFVDRFERSEGNCLNHWIERENTTTQWNSATFSPSSPSLPQHWATYQGD
jgi:hypothetical protein